MQIRPLTISGALEITPVQHGDSRGVFLEWYRSDRLTEAIGHQFTLAQVNLSVSARGVVRGIHYASVPPGQAKYVTCVVGQVQDIIVDLRVGSTTFGEWERVLLDDTDRRAVYLPEGIGHGFCALTDQASVTYLCSEPYAPQREHAVNAFDTELGIDWGTDDVTMSDRDAAAPSLVDARTAGLLPDHEVCLSYIRQLASLSPGDQ
ncbi:MAG: dTDP-4-dehydrorhamnose 3,5-epimerase family protein [Actinomycetota bacterium]|nr:dTDP-4-dehydrorhamnose 3,5-epimerase family protein [Actinomycetota bacterium]